MNIYHGLLFQSGHIADPALVRRLGDAGTPREPAPPPVRPARHGTTGLRWLLEEMVLLGGRPVSKFHHDDLDQPFPPLHPCG